MAAQQNTRLTVLFEADSDVVTAQGQAQIAAFAHDVRASHGKSVKVDGHGTLAEAPENSSGYGVGLSQRRASNVRAALEEQGVRSGTVFTAA